MPRKADTDYGVQTQDAFPPFAQARQANLPYDSLSHKSWWLDAVAGPHWREVTVSEFGLVVGRLPYFEWSYWGARMISMPPLTRTMGPLVVQGRGKDVVERKREMRILGELIKRLPPYGFFKQALSGAINPLPFQFAGFTLSCEYAVHIDCRSDLSELWIQFSDKLRNGIRRADALYRYRQCHDPTAFCRFYEENIRQSGRVNDYDADLIRRLYAACLANDAGAILALYDASERMTAAIFVVWSQTHMQFLLQTRAQSSASGVIDLLLWKAMHLAHERRLVLDLDGIANEAAARRLVKFGGELRQRTIVTRGSLLFATAHHFRRQLRWRLGRREAFC